MLAAAGLVATLAFSGPEPLAAARGLTPAEQFAEFRRICVATGLDAPRALRAAEAEGWSSPAGAADQNVQQRVPSDASGSGDMFVTTMQIPSEGETLDTPMCAVARANADGPGLVREVSAWAGVPAHAELSTDMSTGWMFRELPDGRHERLATLAGRQFNEFLAAGQVALVLVSLRPDGLTLIAYGVARSRGAAT